jgi:hypothetical protein
LTGELIPNHSGTLYKDLRFHVQRAIATMQLLADEEDWGVTDDWPAPERPLYRELLRWVVADRLGTPEVMFSDDE